MKKIVAVLLAVVLVFSFASVANAKITKDQYYARSMLSENELEFYDERYDSFLNGYTERNSNFGLNEERIKKIVNYVWGDSPELFRRNNLYTDKEAQELQNQINQTAEVILSTVTNEMTDCEKVNVIYFYLGKNIAYHYGYNDGTEKELYESQTVVGGLINKKAVCGGIARSLQYLLYQLDIPCYLVDGTYSGQSHGWVIIQIDGQWYHADLTADLQRIKNGQNPTYFLVSDDFIQNDHSIISPDGINYNPTLPECPEMYDHPLYAPALRQDPEATPYEDAVARSLAEKAAQPTSAPIKANAPEPTEAPVKPEEAETNPAIWVIAAGAAAVILLLIRKKRKA